MECGHRKDIGAAGTAARNPSDRRGFTLIELLISLAIVAVLAAIAVPSYQSHVRKAKRADGHQALLRVALAQERFRGQCPRYAGALGGAQDCNAGGSGDYVLGLAAASPEGHYSLSITAANATGFTATATATGAQTADSSAGVSCRVLSIDQDGQRTPSECW